MCWFLSSQKEFVKKNTHTTRWLSTVDDYWFEQSPKVIVNNKQSGLPGSPWACEGKLKEPVPSKSAFQTRCTSHFVLKAAHERTTNITSDWLRERNNYIINALRYRIPDELYFALVSWMKATFRLDVIIMLRKLTSSSLFIGHMWSVFL